MKRKQVLPTKCPHSYAMVFKKTKCWCKDCGQTWFWARWPNGSPKGWRPLPIHKVSHGEDVW